MRISHYEVEVERSIPPSGLFFPRQKEVNASKIIV